MPKVSNIVNRSRLAKLGVIRLGSKDSTGKPKEIGHFIINTETAIAERARQIYGSSPTSLDVSFYSDRVDEMYRCTYQKWGRSKKNGTPHLACEGNGQEAVASEGAGVEKQVTCPCPALGRDCKKTTVIKLLLPKISMTGYFILATKSENNAQTIQTGIELVYRITGGLSMRPLRLTRTEGFAEVNGFKIKKYFLALTLDEEAWERANAKRDALPHASSDGQRQQLERIKPVIPPFEENSTRARIEEERRQTKGRAMVREKIKLHIKHPDAEKALETYACSHFDKASFEELTADQLLELWHKIDPKKEMLGEIFRMLKPHCSIRSA